MGPPSYMRSVVDRNVVIHASVFHDVLKISSKLPLKTLYYSIMCIIFKYCRQRCTHDVVAGT